MLAQTVWPRSGQDRGNRSKVDVAGPSQPNICFQLDLPQGEPQGTRLTRGGGIVVVGDGSLRVAKGGFISAISQHGQVIWVKQLLNDAATPTRYHSAPLALGHADVLLTLQDSYVIIDGHGELRQQVKFDDSLDNSGTSPNLTLDGRLIITSRLGEVCLSSGQGWQRVGNFGYDIVPPALFDDGSLAISGYAGKGFCRVGLDGELIWQTSLHDADLLPTVNQHQFSAVGSINDEISAIFSPSGERIGQYEQPAVFAEYIDAQWIALSHQSIARLSPAGELIWQHPLKTDIMWGALQPIVDQQGRIYAAGKRGIICFDPKGSILFTFPTNGQIASSLSIIAPSKLAFIVANQFIVLAD